MNHIYGKVNGLLCLLFAIILTFTPQHWAFGVGDSGFALSLRRLVLLLICLLFFSKTLTVVKRLVWGKPLTILTAIFGFLLLIAVLAASVSGFLSGQGISAFVPSIDLLLSYLATGAIVCHCAKKYGFNVFLDAVFIVPLVIIFPFVIFEISFDVNFFDRISGLFSSANTAMSDNTFYRGDERRVEGPFFDPINMAEYIVGSICYLLYRISSTLMFRYFVYLSIAIALLLLCNTRSGYVATILSIIIFFALRKKWNLGVIFGSLGITIAVVYADTLLDIFRLGSDGDFDFSILGSEDERSVWSRLLQFGRVGELVSESPLTGFGFTRSLTQRFDLHALDNFYMALLLQGGALYLFSFVGYFVAFFRECLIRSRFTPNGSQFEVFCATFLSSFLIMKNFNSSAHGMVYLLLLYFMMLENRLSSVDRGGRSC